MFYIRSTKNFQPDKFPENCQAGKLGASLTILQKLNLNRNQKINITQTFEQEDMIVQKETTLETHGLARFSTPMMDRVFPAYKTTRPRKTPVCKGTRRVKISVRQISRRKPDWKIPGRHRAWKILQTLNYR